LFLVPNLTARDRWRAAYPATPVAVVGSPRLDDLPGRDDSDGPTVAVIFHWDHYRIPEMASAFAHYRRVLPTLLDRYHVIGHGHPFRHDLAPYFRRIGVEYVPSFAEVCRRADVYVADNTSTLYEFASTGRPVVVLNSPAYRLDVSHGLRFWDAAHVGIGVWEDKLLAPAIDIALADGPVYQADRDDALDRVYAYRTGGARRAADAILAWAENSLAGMPENA